MVIYMLLIKALSSLKLLLSDLYYVIYFLMKILTSFKSQENISLFSQANHNNYVNGKFPLMMF